MNKPLYHGKTVVREVDTQHPLDLHLMSLGGQIYDAKHVFPEYFFIFVPSFNDVINSEIDEWLYVMKHSDTLDSFKSPYMAKVAERMSTLTMTDEEMIAYLQHLKEVYGKRDSLNAAEAKGREEGREEGEYLKAIKTARIMKNKGMPTAVIVECTDLSTDEIEKLVE
jgi:predicted transposase/invertase (TIGR01784 family)